MGGGGTGHHHCCSMRDLSLGLGVSELGWSIGCVLKKGFSHGHQANTHSLSACCRLGTRPVCPCHQESRFKTEELPLRRRNGVVQRQRVHTGWMLSMLGRSWFCLSVCVWAWFCRMDPGHPMCSVNPTTELHSQPKVPAPCLFLIMHYPTIATPTYG